MPETILIIDDNEINRYTFSRLLTKAGFDTLEATDMRGGYEALAAQSIDLIILDVQLRDENGFDICLRLKSDDHFNHIPILLTSAAFIEGRDRAMGFDCGAEGYLTTPIDSLELTASVKALLRIRSAEHAMRQALHKAEQANLAKTQFLANMSHEIRTPMNAIVGLTALLGQTSLDDKQTKFVSTLQQSADSLTMLVNDLLDISKIEDNKLELETLPFHLAELVTRVVDIMGVSATKKGVTLECKAHGADRYFLGDAQRIHQILLNLVSNAIKFTETGGVVVTIHAAKSSVTITVADTGIGIPPDKIDTIFDKFVQADSSTTRRFGGTGLGLSISRSLAELMHGTLSAESRFGEGSVFTLHLPLMLSTDAQSQPDEPQTADIAAGKDMRILVVEDNDANLLVAQSYLEQMGFSVIIAHSGAEALERIKAGGIQAILMDIQMEGLDGLETTRRIRQWEKDTAQTALPIVAMTAFGMADDREKCLAAGMDDFLSKPINIPHFKAVMSRYAH
ncbi:response regulator [Asticcacaulis tiandongensis]|uniref:response regulator n=1 Tax=Asticcacaulis tiandongensis TaxID=2565365 RepID=UPI001129AECF|nr:response regulator [Asticcacaulis tiandongensis]